MTFARARAAVLVGVAASFIAAVDLVRWVRPLLLTDRDPTWLLPRLLLGLFVIAGAALAGGLAGGIFFGLAGKLPEPFSPVPLPLRRSALVCIALAVIGLGTLARFSALQRLPPSLWIDDLSLIAPALELQGAPGDFKDAIRPAPYGAAKPYGTVGVLYLELYRAALLLFGTTVFGVRFLSAAAGVASLLTTLALARALLPRGGGVLAALALAGMRWSLIVSRWGWNAVVLAPIVDIAVLLLLRARRRDSLAFALLSGAAAGLAAHVYLAAWAAGAALLVLAGWPRDVEAPARSRFRLPLLFLAGFACASAPLFLLREGRAVPYFARASDHSLIAEIRYTRSVMPGLAAAADSLAAPWLTRDPRGHHDLPGRSRLGWILGIPVAVAFSRSILRPREELSGYFLSMGCAALAASVAGGRAGVPDGYRFAYLADAAAVAAAAGVLCLLALVPPPSRRGAAIAAMGLVTISGALAARDALLDWPRRRETFDGFHGQDTLLARAAIRWERFGEVAIAPALAHSPITIRAIRRYRLDPDAPPAGAPRAGQASGRTFRLVAPSTPPEPRERVVERVRDAWGRDWGIVLGSR